MRKIILIILAFILNTSIVLWSAKIIAPLKNWKREMSLNAVTDVKNPRYSWTLVWSDWKILDSQNWSNYNQTFQNEGVYDLNLRVENSQTWEMEATSAKLIIWKSFNYFQAFDPQVDVIPTPDQDNEVSFAWTGWEVTFIFTDSAWTEFFKVDTDINADGNKDWAPDNDIDNINDTTYKNWWTFKYTYSSWKNTTALVKLYGFNWESKTYKFPIIFNKQPVRSSSEALTPILKTFPKFNAQEGEVYVPFWIDEVILYAKDSLGDIKEYRIDNDVDIDSDGDSKANNDNDNFWTPSFTTWDKFSVKRTDKDSQVVQLAIISKENKWAALRRKIVWWKENNNKSFEIFSSSDRTYVDNDLTFVISNLNLKTDYSIEWDFNSDWEVDKEDKQSVSTSYDNPWIYKVTVNIKDSDWKVIIQATKDITIEEREKNEIKTKKPIADFSFVQNGNYVTFKQNSIADNNLPDKNLSYLWKFWDWNVSSDPNPEYIYTIKDSFTVELIATDTAWKSASVKKDIEINFLTLESWPWDATNTETKVEEAPISTTKSDSTASKISNISLDKNFDIVMSFLKYLLYIILAIFWLILIYLVIQKVKNPDYSFGEIVEEEREKILSFIEWVPYEPLTWWTTWPISTDVRQGITSVLEKGWQEWVANETPEWWYWVDEVDSVHGDQYDSVEQTNNQDDFDDYSPQFEPQQPQQPQQQPPVAPPPPPPQPWPDPVIKPQSPPSIGSDDKIPDWLK